MALLAHPLDVHYAVKGIDGWPRLRIEVYGVDSYGRIELAGYGCCIVPTSAGTHELRCATWRPCGTLREQFSSAQPAALFFLRRAGGSSARGAASSGGSPR